MLPDQTVKRGLCVVVGGDENLGEDPAGRIEGVAAVVGEPEFLDPEALGLELRAYILRSLRRGHRRRYPEIAEAPVGQGSPLPGVLLENAQLEDEVGFVLLVLAS